MSRRPGLEPPHGTRRRYQWRPDPCRCGACRGANRDTVAMYRARHRAELGDQLDLPRSWWPVAGRDAP